MPKDEKNKQPKKANIATLPLLDKISSDLPFLRVLRASHYTYNIPRKNASYTRSPNTRMTERHHYSDTREEKENTKKLESV